MTQQLCKTYQYNNHYSSEEEHDQEQGEKKEQQQELYQILRKQKEENDKETLDMLNHILDLSGDGLMDKEGDIEDEDYFSEDEYSVIKAFYENEQEDEQEEIETRNIIDSLQQQQQHQK